MDEDEDGLLIDEEDLVKGCGLRVSLSVLFLGGGDAGGEVVIGSLVLIVTEGGSLMKGFSNLFAVASSVLLLGSSLEEVMEARKEDWKGGGDDDGAGVEVIASTNDNLLAS